MMTSGENPTNEQRKTIERLLLDEQVLVHINPQCSGVTLPNHLLPNRTVTLRLSKYFKGSLTTDSEKISAELLFGSDYFTCVMPWQSIWGASSIRGEDFIWSEAAPEDVVDLFLAHQAQVGRSRPKARTPMKNGLKAQRDTSHLKRVK